MLGRYITEAEVKRVIKKLKKAKFPEDTLDDIVHEVMSNAAAGINNEGIECQIKFLLKEGFDLYQILEWVR